MKSIKFFLKRFVFFTLLFFFLLFDSYGEEPSKRLESLLIKYFNTTEFSVEERCQNFFAKISELKNKEEKCQALKLLAEYEEAKYLYAEAAEHYSQSASLATRASDVFTLKLAAARAYIMSGDNQLGAYILKTLLAESTDIETKKEATIYLLFSSLAEADKLHENIQTIKKFIADPLYSHYASTLNFLLYWLTGDEQVRASLIKNFPASIEAAVVQNKASVSPVAFWYLMPRTKAESKNSNTKKDSQREVSNTFEYENAKAYAYQLGFFKNISYAEKLKDELKSKGFDAYIKIENKNDSTSYSVLVKENTTAASISERLKHEGYEAYPIFE